MARPAGTAPVHHLVDGEHERRARQPTEGEVEDVMTLLDVENVGSEPADSPHELARHTKLSQRLRAPRPLEGPYLHARIEVRLDVCALVGGHEQVNRRHARQRAREPGGGIG